MDNKYTCSSNFTSPVVQLSQADGHAEFQILLSITINDTIHPLPQIVKLHPIRQVGHSHLYSGWSVETSWRIQKCWMTLGGQIALVQRVSRRKEGGLSRETTTDHVNRNKLMQWISTCCVHEYVSCVQLDW